MKAAISAGLSLLLLSFTSAAPNESCSGCHIAADAIAGIWSPLFQYESEVVVVWLDTNDNSTIEVFTIPNQSTELSFSSICESAKTSYGWDTQYCLSTTTYVEERRSRLGTDAGWTDSGSWTWSATYPTPILPISRIAVITSHWTNSSGTPICTQSTRNIPINSAYTIQPDDTGWSRVFVGMDGITSTWHSNLPSRVFNTLESGSLASCTPGPIWNVPTTKIPIMGTAATVFSYRAVPSPSPSPSPTVIRSSKGPVAVTSMEDVFSEVSRSSRRNQAGTVIPPAGVTKSGASMITAAPVPLTSILPTSVSRVGDGVVLPNGETLSLGRTVAISGTTYALVPYKGSSTAVVIGSETFPLPFSDSDRPVTFVILPSGNGVVLPNSATLRPGYATTLNGVPVSFGTSGSKSYIVVAGTTVDLVSTKTLPPGFSMQSAGSGIVLVGGPSRSNSDTELQKASGSEVLQSGIFSSLSVTRGVSGTSTISSKKSGSVKLGYDIKISIVSTVAVILAFAWT